ncbi:integral membrane protein [Aspergillus alliaceus]|uniref:Integral membrane protein n=1 Tax=Petromyces alliaceus TaxID=209559 RepID=A0A5N7CNP1_PETAA|nr:integral membrane protein [Aspergillus alliaceus]
MADTSELGHSELGYSHDNLRHVVITATCWALVLSTLAVVLRLVCRRMMKTKWFLDDYLMIVALFFEYVISLAGVVLLYNGLGTHKYYVPPDDLEVYMKTLPSGTFLYPLCITFVKLSIVTFYKRLFPVKPMAIAANVVGLIVILWCLAVCLVGAMTCIPFRKLWQPQVPGRCINLAQFHYGLQIPNILTDAVILVMPMRVVWSLQVSRARKIILSGIFLLGLVTLIFDIVRLVAMVEVSEAGSDITYEQVSPSVWTCIEPAVGITAACLPSMRPLFNRFPRIPWQKLSLRSNDPSEERVNRQPPDIKCTTIVRVNSEKVDTSVGGRSESASDESV